MITFLKSNKLYILLLLYCCTHSVYAFDHLPPSLKGAKLGYWVTDLTDNKVLLKKNDQQRFNPASSIKLFTAFAAWQALGKQYHFTTAIYTPAIYPIDLELHVLARHLFAPVERLILARKTAMHCVSIVQQRQKSTPLKRAMPSLLSTDKNHSIKNLYVKFSGDPTLTTRHIEQLIKKLKTAGINTIRENIIIDDDNFKPPLYPLGLTADDLHWYYAAPVSAIIIDENRQDIILSPNKPKGLRAFTNTKIPIQEDINWTSALLAKNYCALAITVNRYNQFQLSGCWSKTRQPTTLKLAIAHPFVRAQDKIKQILKKSGIYFQGKIIRGHIPDFLHPFAVHYSPPLNQIIRKMLKQSDNLIAGSLTKALGLKFNQLGTFQSGAQVISKILKAKLHLTDSDLVLYEGTGARYDMATPQAFAKLLKTIYQNKTLFHYFINWLPAPNTNGSLAYRMQKYPELKHHVFAKTGYMKHISSLTGFIKTKKKHLLAFTIITNQAISATAVKHYEDAFVNDLYHQ